MGLSNGNGNFSSGPLVFLTPRGKDADGKKIEKPYFTVGRVGEDGKIAQTQETYSSVKGDLVSIQVKDRTFKKGDVEETTREASLYFRDFEEQDFAKRETYRLGLTFSIPACGLFNSLASLTESGDFKGLEVDFYRNKKGYETYAVKQHGKQVKWKYDRDQVPQGEPITDKKGKLVKNDYSERDAFFENELNQIIAVLGAGKKDENADGENQQGESTDDTSAETETAPAPTPAKVTPPKATAPASKPAATTPAKTAGKSVGTKTTTVAKPAQTPPPEEENLDEVPF